MDNEPLLADDGEIISLIKQGAREKIEHCKNSHIGNPYNLPLEQQQYHYQRWNYIQRRSSEILSTLGGRKCK